tara:strand:- start:338 stop:976 length:639 start_codon:yes stop_codon:yes gene_type:complete
MSKEKPINSQTISKIYNSRKIILDLAKERGYEIGDYENFTINEILVLHTNKQLDMIIKNNDTDKTIYYKYHLGPKLRAPHIADYIEDLFVLEETLTKDDELIIVSKDEPNKALKNILNMEYTSNNYFVNIYNFNNYLYNILENKLVPKHTILTDIEKKEIAKKYNIMNDSQWPEISRYDPVAMAIGLRPGDVTEITRYSPTALETKYYRLCL